MAFSSLSRSLLSKMSVSISAAPGTSAVVDETPETLAADTQESGFSHLMNKELYPVRERVVDEDFPFDSEPFSQLNGESIEYMGLLQDDFIIAISNYRLFATQEDGFYSVPLGLIEAMEVFGAKDKLLVLCRDARTFRLSFSSPLRCKLWQERITECLRRIIKEPKAAFAFIHRAYNKDEKMARQDQLRRHVAGDVGVVEWDGLGEELGGDGKLVDGGNNPLLSLKADSLTWRDEVMTMEYERMGMGSSDKNGMKYRPWKITQCNDKYKLCGTYPKLLVVPGSISDEELLTAAKFRMSGRIPAVVWRHETNGCVIARSSQPLVGVLGLWRSAEDEKLLLAISQSCCAPPIIKKPSSNTSSSSSSNHFQLRAVTAFPLVQGSSSAPQLTGGGERETVPKIARNGVTNGYMDDSTPRGQYSDDSDDNEEGFTHGNDASSSSSAIPKLKVFDLRSYAAALGNRAKGGGCECTDYYPNCEVQYKCLPNIHAVRKSFLQLRAMLMSDDQVNFLSTLESTQWLHYLCQLLSVACEVVGVVNDHAQPILIHCSDGWDRTTQVVALAELMLDPYYRTMKGFKILVEREWLGYGHKFGERCGLTTEDGNQQSPVFLQWLDCVHQLTRQYPCDFQFNENFLLKLGRHVYSCLYGTFLYNSMREREVGRVTEDTTSVWALLHEGNTDLVNYLYSRDSIENKVLRPVPNIRSMLLWKEMYTTSLLIPYQTPPTTADTTANASTAGSPSPLPCPPSVGQSNSASSTPSPAHHASLHQTSCLATSDSDEVDTVVKSTTDENEHVQVTTSQTDDTPCLDDSDNTVVLEVNDQTCTGADDDMAEVRGQDVNSTSTEVKGQHDTEEENGVVSGSQEECGAATNGTAMSSGSCIANGHLLMTEQHRCNGLNDTTTSGSSSSRRVLANVLTQHPPSSVIIELKDLTHVENGRLLSSSMEKNHLSSTSTLNPPSHSPLPPLVNGERETSTVLANPSESHSEPILVNKSRIQPNSSSCGDSSHQTSVLLVDAMAESPTYHHAEAENSSRKDKLDTSVMTFSVENEDTGNRLPLGVDGLPCSLDPVQKRVRELDLKHRREVADLRVSLKEAQLQVAEAARLRTLEQEQGTLMDGQGGGGGVGEGGGGVREGEYGNSSGHSLHSDGMPSPSSIHSWDCVEQEDEHGVRWIPDHAATHCQICGAAFWTARRKHHCRSCGGVFCGTCSNFFCPVPHEQLFIDVRVCEKCYYRLDGHLNKNGTPQTTAPT